MSEANTTRQEKRTPPKVYHKPSFTRLGKVAQFTGQTTARPTTTAGKNGRAS
ncbi:MAG: hypothetical protein U0175_29845 [Caldilineaceae bacterium]